ncbi:flagellar hook-length control protein FliK [Arthrobacter zhaoxinii]|uniref:Flagellar hook-length control protein FliK n=1 Tax=Arthrobacter zhaoxinii TaxID=2964616 RepID=A0ABY5YV76_9MICC|nr:flagellar hook-length control protein FliK [Arthrobacter zhaoxinii]UWX97545.1 flagellar hook-length control protein FliK [Arthrobacter zhaoxinii]
MSLFAGLPLPAATVAVPRTGASGSASASSGADQFGSSLQEALAASAPGAPAAPGVPAAPAGKPEPEQSAADQDGAETDKESASPLSVSAPGAPERKPDTVSPLQSGTGQPVPGSTAQFPALAPTGTAGNPGAVLAVPAAGPMVRDAAGTPSAVAAAPSPAGRFGMPVAQVPAAAALAATSVAGAPSTSKGTDGATKSSSAASSGSAGAVSPALVPTAVAVGAVGVAEAGPAANITAADPAAPGTVQPAAAGAAAASVPAAQSHPAASGPSAGASTGTAGNPGSAPSVSAAQFAAGAVLQTSDTPAVAGAVADAAAVGPVPALPPMQPSPAVSGAAVVPAAVPASPVQAAPALLPQVSQPLFSLAAAPQGEHVMTLSITPDTIGPVTVRAHVGADGVRIELFAPSDAGREALRGLMTDLRRDLAGSGMTANLSLSAQDSPGGGTERRNGGTDRDAAQATPQDPGLPAESAPRTYRPGFPASASTIDFLA